MTSDTDHMAWQEGWFRSREITAVISWLVESRTGAARDAMLEAFAAERTAEPLVGWLHPLAA